MRRLSLTNSQFRLRPRQRPREDWQHSSKILISEMSPSGFEIHCSQLLFGASSACRNIAGDSSKQLVLHQSKETGELEEVRVSLVQDLRFQAKFGQGEKLHRVTDEGHAKPSDRS